MSFERGVPWRLILRSCGAVALAVSALAHGGGFGDPERNWVEGAYELPAFPERERMRTVDVSAASPNRFLVDPDTLSLGSDGVVRYVLLVETPGGASTTTFEGIHCGSQTVRIYAIGRADGSWSLARDSAWQPILDNSYNRVHAALARDYFCDHRVPPRNRGEALRRLTR